MIPRTISFTNLDGVEVSEQYYFALSTVDVIEIEEIAEHQERFGDWLESLVKANRFNELIRVWKQMMFKSVARREGQRLIKGPEVVDEFVQTGAFDALFDELLDSGPAQISAFFTGMMPRKLVEKAAEVEQTIQNSTPDELLTMSDEDFYKAAGTTNVMEMDPRFLAIAMKRRVDKAA